MKLLRMPTPASGTVSHWERWLAKKAHVSGASGYCSGVVDHLRLRPIRNNAVVLCGGAEGTCKSQG